MHSLASLARAWLKTNYLRNAEVLFLIILCYCKGINKSNDDDDDDDERWYWW